MESKLLIARALKKEFLSADEGQYLFENIPTSELMWIANELRQIQVPGNVVTWQIDRNVNTTNACVANCKFCNFFRHPKHEEVYVTDIETYKRKIEETMLYIASEYGRSLNLKTLTACYLPTKRNHHCYTFWKQSGFEHDEKTDTFMWNLKHPYPRPNCIEIISQED